MSTERKYTAGFAARFRRFLRCTRGAQTVEYMLLLVLGALGLMLALERFRLRGNLKMKQQAQTIISFDTPNPSEVIAGLGGFGYVEDTSCTGGLCTLPGINCFAAGTLVATESGDRPIESIQFGERVWSRNETTQEVGLHAVTFVHVNHDKYVVDLKLGHDALHTETITVTPNHPFWVEGQGWTPAEALATDAGWSPEGPLSMATTFERTETTTVYNLEVEGDHTYFVGHAHALVHNAAGPAPGQPAGGVCPGTGGGIGPLGKTQQEIDDCVRQYLQDHPYSQYHDPALRPELVDECTNKIYSSSSTGGTGRLRDPNAGNYPDPPVRAEDKPGCAPITSTTTTGNQQKAQQRQKELCKGNTQNAIDISETSGDLAAKNYAKNAFPPEDGWQQFPARGANNFDLVLYNNVTHEVVIIEAKGGDSGLGTRWGAGGPGTDRVEQGTKEYIEAVAGAMADQGLADDIRDAMQAKNLRYMLVRQPFEDGTCNPPKGKASDLEINEFDMKDGNTACPPKV
jgi:Flp pilus assembly pilin Flp